MQQLAASVQALPSLITSQSSNLTLALQSTLQKDLQGLIQQ